MKGLEVGGLALVVNESPKCAVNIGRVVTVLEIDVDCPIGFHVMAGATGLTVESDDGVELSDSAWFEDGCLMPLQGDPDAVVVDEKDLALS